MGLLNTSDGLLNLQVGHAFKAEVELAVVFTAWQEHALASHCAEAARSATTLGGPAGVCRPSWTSAAPSWNALSGG